MAKKGGSYGGGQGGARRSGGGGSLLQGAKYGPQTDANALLSLGITGPSAALAMSMFDKMGHAGEMPNISSIDRMKAAFAQLLDSPGRQTANFGPAKLSMANPYAGKPAGMSIGGGLSPYQSQLAEELNRMAAMRKEKQKDMQLERKFANAALVDKLNLIKGLLGQSISGQDVQRETYFERQAGNLVPLTRTTTRNRDYLPQLLQMLGS